MIEVEDEGERPRGRRHGRRDEKRYPPKAEHGRGRRTRSVHPPAVPDLPESAFDDGVIMSKAERARSRHRRTTAMPADEYEVCCTHISLNLEATAVSQKVGRARDLPKNARVFLSIGLNNELHSISMEIATRGCYYM